MIFSLKFLIPTSLLIGSNIVGHSAETINFEPHNAQPQVNRTKRGSGNGKYSFIHLRYNLDFGLGSIQ